MKFAQIASCLFIILLSQRCIAGLLTTDIDPLNTSISTDDIAVFLSNDIVIDNNQLALTPKILGNPKGTTYLSQGDTFYSRGEFDLNKRYALYHIEKKYINELNQKTLGYQLSLVGYAKVSADSAIPSAKNISLFTLTISKKEARKGDLILPANHDRKLPKNISIQTLHSSNTGRILGFSNSINIAAAGDSVIIDKGERDNIKLGTLFSVPEKQPSSIITETTDENATILTQSLNEFYPATSVGSIIVYKVYPKMSIGLIIKASEIIRAGDIIKGDEL